MEGRFFHSRHGAKPPPPLRHCPGPPLGVGAPRPPPETRPTNCLTMDLRLVCWNPVCSGLRRHERRRREHGHRSTRSKRPLRGDRMRSNVTGVGKMMKKNRWVSGEEIGDHLRGMRDTVSAWIGARQMPGPKLDRLCKCPRRESSWPASTN